MIRTSGINRDNIPYDWESVSENQWTDWRWQMSARINTVEKLANVFPALAGEISHLAEYEAKFRLAITPFIACLLGERGKNSPVWRQSVPSPTEFEASDRLTLDPLAEDRDSPVPGLIHRYANRVVLLVTDRCAVYCRHCNRRRRARGVERDLSSEHLQKCLRYLASHREISEVIMSGGDPLTLTDPKIASVLNSLGEISTLNIIRICTRIPVVLPYRITADLCRILKNHQPVYLNIHVNHPSELTPEMRSACERLADSGIPLGSQTVLLKGVNDDAQVLIDLMNELLALRVKPYSLYHGDPVKGTAHFRTSIATGRALIKTLIEELSGLAVPHYIVDAPDGRGKIPILPDFIEEMAGDRVILKDLKGRKVDYVDGSDV